MSWYRRGWLLRGQATCYVLFNALLVGGTTLIYLGVAIPDWVVALSGSLLLGAWCGLYWLPLWLEERDRGPAGTLVLDGNTIALRRDSRVRWRRATADFESGWMFDSSQTAIELQLPGGDLLVACPVDADDARRWIAATGLDAPTRTLTMRLDEGVADVLWQALVFSLVILTVAGVVVEILLAKTLPEGWVDVILMVVMLGSGLLHARAWGLATVVVDGNGVRIRRWGRPTRHVSWSSLRAIDDRREPVGDRFLELSLTDGGPIRLRSKLELFRRKILIERLQHGIASTPHDDTHFE